MLITGARAPVALDMTRRLARAGHEVHVADSIAFPLASFSRYARRFHRLPPPRQQPERFSESLQSLAGDFDLIVPTCEEVLWVRQALSEKTYAPTLEQLVQLHSKWEFSRISQLSPQTWLLPDSPPTPRDLVYKPVFSRFGTETLIRPLRPPVSDKPWVAQRYVEGRALCSYSLAHAGRLTAHVSYAPLVRLHDGAGVVFESLLHERIRAWVEGFVHSQNLTGQLSFDFIEGPEGLKVLECNPRTTSGMHLFPDDFPFAEALLGQETQDPPPGRRSMLTLPALYANFSQTLRLRPIPADFSLSDPLPFLAQPLSFLPLWLRSRQSKISLLHATTFDFEWNQ